MALRQWQFKMIGVVDFHGQRSGSIVEPDEANGFAASIEGKQHYLDLVLRLRESPSHACIRRGHQEWERDPDDRFAQLTAKMGQRIISYSIRCRSGLCWYDHALGKRRGEADLDLIRNLGDPSQDQHLLRQR